MSKFSKRINDIINEKHVTQRQIAEMAGVTEASVSCYVNGKRTPRTNTLKHLAEALDVTTDYLLGINNQDEERKNHIQYLQHNLEKLNPEQLDKAVKIFKIVFDDVF